MSLDFYLTKVQPTEVYWGNMTHNVTPMWRLAGIYDDLYNSQGKTASEILPNLHLGLAKMLKQPADFKRLNPENGWGDYESAVRYLRDIIAACEEHPDAEINISK